MNRLKYATTLKSACETAVEVFKSSNVSEPLTSARYLLQESIRTDTFPTSSELEARMLDPFTPSLHARFEAMCRRRLLHEPVQYIIGEWDFHSITLKVRAPVLIPRPETEQLVCRILNDLEEANVIDQPLRILDIGSGTGCIGLSLLTHLPNSNCIAIDPGLDAVELSRENADFLGLTNRYECIQVAVEKFDHVLPFDLIVSNPPYIPSVDMSTLAPELNFEDKNALCGGLKGLDIINEIFKCGGRLLKQTNSSEHDSNHVQHLIYMEVDSSHPVSLTSSNISQSHGLHLIDWWKDHQDLPRFCVFGRQGLGT